MKKRKYLYRLVAVMILILIFPVILFFEFFWKNAFVEMEENNQEFYEKVLDSYISSYEKKLQELKLFAAEISANSKEADSIFLRGQEGISENTYQVYMAVNELREKYSPSDVKEWGIYFYDIDKVITSEFTYTGEQFVRKYAEAGEETATWNGFFARENYSSFEVLFNTTNTEQSLEGNLLVGVCSKIGKNNDPVLIFYLISPQNIKDSLTINGEEGIAYYLLDGERILLAWGDATEENAKYIWEKDVYRDVAGAKQQVIYGKESAASQLTIMAYVSQDTWQNNIVDYAYNMKRLLLITAMILLIICAGSLYIAYKPVYDLTSDFDYSSGSEFEMIRSVMDNKDSRIVEQEMLIMDLLINHLIYGVPISEKRIKRLGIDNALQYYCVFLVDGYVFVNSEAAGLVEEIEKKFGARIFVTDWQGGNSSVVIAFLKEKDISAIQELLNLWMEESCVTGRTLYTGMVVDKLDEIQASLGVCFELKRKKNEEEEKERQDALAQARKEEQQKKLKEDILEYLEKHYRESDLNQPQLADMFRISTYTLSRLFKKQMGVGFTEYLTAKRLEYAKELLLTTTYSVRDISIMSGFASESYFSRSFKLYEGVSPSSFRRK